MAKKSKKEVGSVEDSIREEFGAGVMVPMNYVLERKRTIVSVSPMVDGLLGGGVPFGSFVIPTGPPKVGKTAFALSMAANALKIPTQFDVPRKLFIYNIESRLNARDILGLKSFEGIESDRVEVIGSERGNILTAEKYLDIGERLINEKPGSIHIFDSFSNLCSSKGMDKEWDGDAYRDNVPVMLSLFCKRISNVIPINESIVVGITQRYANTGPGHKTWSEGAGNKVQYAVDVKMQATHKTPWKVGETTIGHEIHWECACSPLLNGECQTKATSKFRYGYGMDKEAEMINVAQDLGLIKKGGAWYTLGEEKFQGLEKVRQHLVDNPEIYDSMNTQYREMMGLQC